MAAQLREFKVEVDSLIDKKGMKKDDAIFNVLKDYIKASKNIRFEGDGYSQEWENEAARRGLSNVKTTPQALDFLISDSSVKLFDSLGILNHKELHARHEIMLEDYFKKIQIESRVLGDMAGNHIVPTALRYQSLILENMTNLMKVFSGETLEKMLEAPRQIAEEISTRVATILSQRDAMVQTRKQANKIEDMRERAIEYCEKVLPFMQTIRYNSDKLEMLIDDEVWTLPKYRELLFIR